MLLLTNNISKCEYINLGHYIYIYIYINIDLYIMRQTTWKGKYRSTNNETDVQYYWFDMKNFCTIYY